MPAKPYRSATARISTASVTTTPEKPSSSRSRSPRIRGLRVAGRSGSRAGTSRCPVITACTPAATAARKGTSSPASSRARRRDPGQVVVGVDPGVAVAGEVLGAGGHPGGLEAADPGGGVPGHQLRVGAEGAHPDHRVGRVDVDVGVRGVVEGDAAVGEFAAEVAGHLLGEGGVVDRTEGEVAGAGAAPAGLDPGDVAGLLVDGHQHVGSLGAQRGGERGHLLGVDDVAGEQHHRAEPVGQPPADPVGRGGADEAGLQDGGGQARQVALVHPAPVPPSRVDGPVPSRCCHGHTGRGNSQ